MQSTDPWLLSPLSELEFRQESKFYYIIGYNESNACAIYDLKTHKLTLIVYAMPEDSISWLGDPLTESEPLVQYDVDEIRSSSDLVKVLNGSNASTLHTLRKKDMPTGVRLAIDTTRLAGDMVNAQVCLRHTCARSTTSPPKRTSSA